MKLRIILFTVMGLLILAVAACSPQPIPVATPSPRPPTKLPITAAESPTPTANAITAAASPTPETITIPTETVPAPTLESFQAAPATFHPGDPIQLDHITMTSLTEGWGLSGPYVLVTDDGGQTWREVTPPESLPGGPPDKAYGTFLNNQTAWVVFSQGNQIAPEATVWHTTDGGSTWTHSAPLMHQAYGDIVWAEFAVLDAEHIWLMMRGVYAGAGTHYSHDLFRSTDGGRSWTSLDGEISDDYTGLVFADASNGWRTYQTTGAYASAPPDYAVTTDGGANWEDRQLPPPPGTPGLFDAYAYCETYQPVLLSTQSVWVLMGCFDYYSPPHEFTSYLYTSDDGGATWKTVLLPNKVLASQDTLLYFDASHALLLGHEIYRSTDGGQTWEHLSSVSWDGQFSFVDPKHGWAVGQLDGEGGLVKTTDGGTTWILIHPTISG